MVLLTSSLLVEGKGVGEGTLVSSLDTASQLTSSKSSWDWEEEHQSLSDNVNNVNILKYKWWFLKTLTKAIFWSLQVYSRALLLLDWPKWTRVHFLYLFSLHLPSAPSPMIWIMSDISSTPLLQALPSYWDHFCFGSFWFDVLLQNVVIVLGNFVV